MIDVLHFRYEPGFELMKASSRVSFLYHLTRSQTDKGNFQHNFTVRLVDQLLIFNNQSECIERVQRKIMLKFSSGGQVVIMLTFYSGNSSSIPAEVYSSYSVKLFEKNVNKNKIGRGWSIQHRPLGSLTIVSLASMLRVNLSTWD